MKNNRIILLALVIILTLSSFAFSDDEGDVFVIPIEGEINSATANYLNNIIKNMDMESTQAIIFEIDTYGGLIDQAERIKNLILSINIPTISFVNNKAESAGVLITIASEYVVMAPNSTIGSAETIPNTEKIMSLWRSFLRDTAQHRGRNSDIIEAMADKDIVVEGISTKGKLINLTSQEALTHGIADFVSNDYNEILEEFSISSKGIVEVKEGLAMKFSKLISNPYISSFLLTLGFVGMVIEIMTPGFGFGGTISIIGFGLYFGGNILAGNSQWTSLILFITGIILLIVEGIIPGFGLPGIGGIIFIVIGTILAMNSLAVAILSLSIAIIISTLLTILLMKLGYKSKLFNAIVLNTSHESERGYLSVDSMDKYLNKEGTTLSGLRPAGFIDIDGERVDVLSEGGFISKDSQVKVVRVEGSKIFVRRV